MAWQPVAGLVPQYQKSNGDLASGFYIKFFANGTSTAINMATDNTGATLLAKAQINSSGYPITAASAVLIPHIDQAYKISLFPTSADADANTNAEWTIDDIGQFSTSGLSSGSVGTVAALKALIGQNDNEVVEVLGRVTEGDEGGGTFYFDENSSAADDDATIYQPDTGTGRWLRIFSTEVRPEWWGALRDGSTDDTAALQAAGTFAEDNKYTLLLSNGEYDFSTTLVFEDRITIRGQNKEDTKLVWVGGASIAVHLRAVFAGGDDSEECWVGHFSIINEGTGTIGLQIDPSYTTLDHVRVYHDGSNLAFSTAMVQTDKTVNVNQLKCYNLEIRGDNATGGTMGFHYARGSNSVFHGGSFSSFQTCLKVGDFTENGNEVSNLDISGGALFEIQGPFQTGAAVGLHVDGATGINISGRYEFGGGTPTIPDSLGIKFNGRLRGCNINNCDFFGSGAATSGIEFGETTENPCGVVIGGNSFLSIGSATDHIINLTGTENVITGATQANPVVLTVTAHTFSNGDEITVEDVVGMTEINDRKFIVANQATNTIELTGEDGTGHTAYGSAGTAAKKSDPQITVVSNALNSIGGNLPITNGILKDQDATPSFAPGNFFTTANTVATTITAFDGVDREDEKVVTLLINDNFTTIDFTGTNLKGNNARDWQPTSGAYITAHHKDQIWYCEVFRSGTDEFFTGQLVGNAFTVKPHYKYANVDTEGLAASDDLEIISGGAQGDIITIQSNTSSARDVTVTDLDNTATPGANIQLEGSINHVLSVSTSSIHLVNNGGLWCEIARSTN